MTTLSKQFRSPSSPSPIYGIRPGFNIGDFENRTAISIPAISSSLTTGRTSTGTSGAIAANSRVVKVVINVTSNTPTDKVTVTIKSASDSYSVAIATYAALTPGSYDFFLGGWGSPSGDVSNGTYLATKYGPSSVLNDADADNPTGDQDTDDPDPAASSNYVGGTYNPVLFLSLDGYDLKATTSAFVGSPTVDVSFVPVS